MSADNWGVCMPCLRLMRQAKALSVELAKQSYGKVPADEYQAAMEAAEAMPDKADETLREDFEIFLDETGRFFISYRGECQVCGFGATFKHDEMLPESSKPSPSNGK